MVQEFSSIDGIALWGLREFSHCPIHIHSFLTQELQDTCSFYYSWVYISNVIVIL